MKGRAAIYTGYGKPFEIEELPLPEVEPDAILVKVSLAGICGSDLHYWRGDMAAGPALPTGGTVTGHEMTGRVYRLGRNITTDSLGQPLAEGDRIAYCYFYPCKRCYVCLQGQLAACPNRTFRRPARDFPHFVGAYAEYYYLLPGHYVYKVPDELSDEAVTPVNCALSQVIYGLSKAGLRFGDAIVIQGAGGLGINAAAVAKDMGAETVIVIDRLADRLELARQFGADYTINAEEHATAHERIDLVREYTRGRGADVVAELVGLPSVVPEGIAMTRNGGTYLEIGNISPRQTVEIDPSLMVFGSKRYQGVLTYDPWVIPRALDFLVRNRDRFPFEKIISHRFPLDQINEAFEQAEWFNRSGDQAKITRASIVP